MATINPSTTNTSSSTMQFTGAISGLDTTSIISALLDAEKAPLTVIANRRTALQATQTAYESLRTLMGTLQTAAKAFTTSGVGGARTASTGNSAVFTASAATGTVAGSYAVQVNHLATSTRATSTAAIGAALTDADLDTTVSSLALAGTMTGGTIGIVVDGKIVNATIGAPGTATLRQVTDAIAAAVQGQIQANEGSGSTATVTASIVGNKLQLSLSGSSSSHVISFGVGGDTSNANTILGLTGVTGATLSSASPITGLSSLGVVRTTSVLDAAGLTGLATASTGTMTINGTAIAYDTAKDSLTALITRINASSAGVVASLDRGNDRLVLTSRSGGAAPISISDTGTLATALDLAPGTTDAQQLGTQAQVTVDGRIYYSNSNTVSTAIDGVKISLLSEGTSTLTVAPDTATTTKAVQDLVDAYNALADKLDTLTSNPVGGTKGALVGESGVRDIALNFRSLLTSTMASSGVLLSLADIGVTTGAIGSAKGTTNRLQLDTAKLSSALDANSSAVADLFAVVLPTFSAGVNAWTKIGGNIDGVESSITSQLRDLDDREVQANERVALRQAALEAKFAAMEATLAQLQTTTNSLGNTIAQQNKSTG